MQENKRIDLVYLTSEYFTRAGGVRHGFSTRLGGASRDEFYTLNLSHNRGDWNERVIDNIQSFCFATKCTSKALVRTKQVHGTTIRAVTKADALPAQYQADDVECDGLITATAGITLMVLGADCLPILFYDPQQRVIAAVHAGWRGTAANIAGKAVDRMVDDFGCQTKDILCAIGPGIGPCCFLTDEDVPLALTQTYHHLCRPFIKAVEDNKFSVDLKRINAIGLLEKGLAADHIEISDDCTCCLEDKYFSHRRMGDKRGSHGAVIQLIG